MIQKIIDLVYREPRSNWRKWQRFGGYFEYQKMLQGQREMQGSAGHILIMKEGNGLPVIKVSYLTGCKFWYQTLFCAYSLQKVTPNPIHFTFYDDGSLNQVGGIHKQVANSTIVYSAEIEERVNEYLPPNKYPYLHQKRKVYKHIRKLTDVYAGTSGWKLMLDSDMLFTATPTEIIEWLQKPEMPIYMQEEVSSYGFPKEYMESLSGCTIPNFINVGCLGLNNEIIDWDKLEYWAKDLEVKYGNSYYLEQALSAMIIGNKSCIKLDKEQYVVYPKENILYPKAKLFHYVDLSKAAYFRSAWRNAVQ